MALDGDPTGRRARWALEINPYNWTIEHKQGLKHCNADSLSRRPRRTEDSMPIRETVSVNYVSVETQRASCTYIRKHSVISAMANPQIAHAVILQFTSYLRNMQVIG